MKIGNFIFFVLILVFLPLTALSQQDDTERKGLDIMLKHYGQMKTRNWRSDVTMELVDLAGKVQHRHLKRLSKTDAKDREKYHLRFLDPPRIRNTTLLMVEHIEREDDIWAYFPAIKKVQRISGANLRSSYMGTEFSYKDLKREKVDPEKNKYLFEKMEDIYQMAHYVIKAVPISKREKIEQGYQYRKLWIRQDNYLATRIEYYDEDGDHLKTLIGSDLRVVGESGKSRYFQLVMANTKGVKTILKFRMLRIDEEDPADKYFTKTHLMRKY
jgi:hypothetical protein